MGNHLERASDNIANNWQEAHGDMEFLRKMNQNSRSVSFIQEIKYPPPWVQLDRERWNLFNIITFWVKICFSWRTLFKVLSRRDPA